MIHYFLTLSTSQANPSSSPSWVLAEHAVIVQVLVLICSIFNCSKIFINHHIPHQAEGPAPNLVYWQKWEEAHLKVLFPSLTKTYHQQFFQLLPGLLDSFRICGVDDVDQSISVCEVVSPVFSERLLSSYVPYVELKLVMGQVFDVEALSGRNCADVLS